MSLADPSPGLLCGNELSIYDAVVQSGDIYIGKIIGMDGPGLDSPGETSYGNVKIEIVEYLRQAGENPARSDSCELIIKYFGNKGREQPPKVGETYIMFVKSRPNRRVIKLLIGDKKTRSMVEHDIAAAATTQATGK